MIDNYNDLKIGKYLEILEACKAGGDELETQVALIAALSGKTETEILNMPITEYSALTRSASFLSKAPELPDKPAKVYEVGGFRLVPVMDAGKITTAQYIDFQTLAKHKEGKVVEILSCLLVPEGKRYNEGYDIADVHKAIREDMSVADAMGTYAFFLNSCRKLTRDTLYCSAVRLAAKKMPLKEKAMVLKTMIRAARLV